MNRISSLAANMIKQAYGEQASIIWDVLIFISNKTTNNVINDIIFSLDEFCKEFGYTKDEMQRTLPQFVGIPDRNKPYINDHFFDGVFEYAIYKAFTTALVFSNRKIDVKGFDLRRMLLFRNMKAFYNKDDGDRIYSVELDYRVKQWIEEGGINKLQL